MVYPPLNPQNSEMSWDLRTIYANFIVAPTLINIADARTRQDFGAYWKYLNDLYVVVAHKIGPKEDSKETFLTLKQAAANIIKANEATFEGNDTTPTKMYAIDKALNDMEMYLYKKMAEADMFGAKRFQENLG